MLFFEFDSRKAAANFRKHRVSFSEAMSVFDDPIAETFPDDLHSQNEDRFITIGLISHQEDGDCIRLIGARRATVAEKRTYEDLKARSQIDG